MGDEEEILGRRPLKVIMMAPVIFLDWDGVLIGEDRLWSDLAMTELNRLCRETGAAIVLTTSCRYSRSIEGLHSIMLQNGLNESIIVLGETRDLSGWRGARAKGQWLYGFERLSKGEEIGQWLATYPDVEHFIVIDDQPGVCAPYETHTVSPVGAFSAKDRIRAMILLGVI